MARNGKSRTPSRRNKIEPSALTLTFVWNADLLPAAYIDLSQVCSLVNRRFYRQGLNWAVAGFKFLTQAGTSGQLQCQKLPNTWVMANAWEKGMRAWMRMNNEALSETESVRPRFLDYKVFADAQHSSVGKVSNLLPTSAGPVLYSAGEWEMSKYVVPDTTQGATGGINNFEIIATGASYPGAGASGLNTVSLIEGYAASRGLPAILDPNAPDDAFDVDGATPENYLQALFNEGTRQDDTVLTDLVTENNQAPYPFENDGVHLDTMYPGGANQGPGLEVHDGENVSITTIGNTTRLKGGNFPCGLIKLVTDIPGQINVQINLIPGSHRGYLAESMTEM